MMIDKKILLALAIVCGLLLGFTAALGLAVFGENPVPVKRYKNTLQENITPAEMLPLVWERNNPERREWSVYLFSEIQKNFYILDKASDMDYFCANYNSLPEYKKVNVWGQLFAAMTYYESGFKPNVRYVEPMSDLDPVTKQPIVSEGLLQLGYSDNLYHGCRFDWESDSKLDPTDPKKSIFNPYKNLECGVKIMSDQIKKHGAVAINRGAYWAVIKVGHRNEKFAQIKKIVGSYTMCGNNE